MTLRNPLSVLLGVALLGGAARADVQEALTVPDAPAALGEFLDDFFAERLPAHHIPGAVFVWVRDGRVVLSRGYGVANLEHDSPVDPETTAFRVGSVSKLFTAVAVMTLVERGVLDLDADVNEVLTWFQVPGGVDAPVTLRHLLTHTAGFDERLVGMGAPPGEKARPLREYLAERLPDRVWPPGRVHSYSNHGFALAGLAVENASGKRFSTYVEEAILRPLGMTRSSFEPGPALLAELATGYSWDGTRNVANRYADSNIAPAGQLVSTGRDMARFMIALLQDGGLGESRIVGPATAREMYATHFTPDPRLPGVGLSFFHRERNGTVSLEHGGDLSGFASLLYLVPEHDLGFFMSANGDAGAFLREELIGALMDRTFPVERHAPVSASPELIAEAGELAGRYRWNRYSRDAFTKLLALEVSLDVDAAAGLTLRLPLNVISPLRFHPVEPGLYRAVDGDQLLSFRRDARGEPAEIFVALFGMPLTAERLDWYETGPVQLGTLLVCALVFVSAALWPLAALVRRLRGRATSPQPRAARVSRWVLGLAAACFVAFPIAAGVGASGHLISDWMHTVPTGFIAGLALATSGAALAAPTPLLAALAWVRGWWSIPGRIHYSLASAAALVFAAQLHYWNLLGLRY